MSGSKTVFLWLYISLPNLIWQTHPWQEETSARSTTPSARWPISLPTGDTSNPHRPAKTRRNDPAWRCSIDQQIETLKAKKAILSNIDHDSEKLMASLCDFNILMALTRSIGTDEMSELCNLVKKYARGQRKAAATPSKQLKLGLKNALGGWTWMICTERHRCKN